jgi:hypothetical protein
VLADLNANSDLEWFLEENNGRGECFVLMIKKIRAYFGMTRIGSARLRQYLVAAEGNAAAVQLAAAAVEDARSAEDDPAGEFTAVASLKLACTWAAISVSFGSRITSGARCCSTQKTCA